MAQNEGLQKESVDKSIYSGITGPTIASYDNLTKYSMMDSIENASSVSISDSLTGEITTVNSSDAAISSDRLDTSYDYFDGYTDITSRYASGNSRLVKFNFSDGSDDNNRRAWMQIVSIGSIDGKEKLKEYVLDSDYYSILAPVYKNLIEGYNAIIITGMQEQLAEKQAVMPTVGDSFAMTFSGKEPQLLVMSGYLPFDMSTVSNTVKSSTTTVNGETVIKYGMDDVYSNWYTVFMHAYKFLLRASILAKYRCILRIIFPDFSSYYVYPVSINCSLTSDNDTMIPFNMSAYVANSFAPYDSTLPMCPTTYTVNNPADIGLLSSNSVWADCLRTGINNINNNSFTKTLSNIASVGSTGSNGKGIGAIDWTNLSSYGKRATKGTS